MARLARAVGLVSLVVDGERARRVDEALEVSRRVRARGHVVMVSEAVEAKAFRHSRRMKPMLAKVDHRRRALRAFVGVAVRARALLPFVVVVFVTEEDDRG